MGVDKEQVNRTNGTLRVGEEVEEEVEYMGSKYLKTMNGIQIVSKG